MNIRSVSVCVCLLCTCVIVSVNVCGDQVILFVDRHLEIVYPQYPSENEFLNYIQGLGLEDGELKLLSRFVIEKQRLEVNTIRYLI